MCVLQTFSKEFGLAGVRYASAGRAAHSKLKQRRRRNRRPPFIQVMTNAKAPYNISTPTAQLALAALSPSALSSTRATAATLLANRTAMLSALAVITGVGPAIGSNEAHFVLVPILAKDSAEPDNARALRMYKLLADDNGGVLRFRENEPGCTGCARITVGTEEENRVAVETIPNVSGEM